MNPDEEVPPQEDPFAAYQRKHGGVQPPAKDPFADYLAKYGTPTAKAQSPAAAAGRLPAIQKAGDEALSGAIADEQSSTPERLAAHALNTAQGIPGMEAGEAAMGALGSRLPLLRQGAPLSFAQSRDALRSQTGTIGGKTSFVEKALGGAALVPFLPKNPALAGGVLGAADQALSANDESAGQRAFGTAVGGVGGAAAGQLVGKVVQGGSNMLRSALSKNPASNVIERQAARSASASDMYGSAMRAGQGKEATQAVKAFLADPEIQPIVEEIAKTEPFKNLPADGPEMLDQVYKTLSDQAAIVKKGKMALNPSRVNIGNLRGKDIGMKQDALLNAMETPGSREIPSRVLQPEQTLRPEQTFSTDITTAQAPRPTLREALSNFQDRTVAAFKRKEGTVDQQMARTALERHGAEDAFASLRGAPAPRSITEPAIVQPAVVQPGTTVRTEPVLPTYRNAVQDYAKRSGELEAFGKGYDVQHSTSAGNAPPFKGLTKKTPQSLAEWAKTATPDQLQAASEGILGRRRLGAPAGGIFKSMLATDPTTKNLRAVGANTIPDILQQLGITTANAPFATP